MDIETDDDLISTSQEEENDINYIAIFQNNSK